MADGIHTHFESSTRSGERRLSEKIRRAFHYACDARQLTVARHLLDALDAVSTIEIINNQAEREKSVTNLVGAHQRLWQMKNGLDQS